MPTNDLVNSILLREQLASAATAKVAADLAALPADQVQHVNRDISSAVATVLGALPKLLALRPAIMGDLPNFDTTALDKLEDYALALHDMHVHLLSLSETPDELRALGEEGHSLRERLRTDALTLSKRGLIDPTTLDDCRGLSGYKNIATDLGILVAVLRGSWPQIQTKCAINEGELDRADRISAALLRFVGLRDQSPAASAAAADRRARAFTLVIRSYDQARRAVTYLRWDDGDAETIAPSLYSGRKRRSPDDTADEPATAPHSDLAPAGGAVTTSAPGNGSAGGRAQPEAFGPPGSPNSNPFTPS